MKFVAGTRLCSKEGVCYRIVETTDNVISLMNTENATIVAYKVDDLELFLPVFGNGGLLCLG